MILDPTAVIAEFLGTFLLVLTLFATVGNAFAVGGALALITILIGKISGAHVNPAISFTMFIKGSLSLYELIAYALAQIAGGVASLYTYRAFQA